LILSLVCDTSQQSESLLPDLINILDYNLAKLPKLKTLPKYDSFIDNLLTAHLKLENLTTADISNVEVNIRCRNLFRNEFLRFQFYNQALSVLDQIVQGIQENVLKPNLGNLVLLFKQIEFEECDKKTYIKVLNEITDMVSEEFNTIYPEFSYKNHVINQFL